MRKIEFEELKRVQLDILIAVHDFCVKNDIRYSLAYGTLIGAVRHKGYIPWDDDIDIMMPRSDYNRFIDTFNGNYNHLTVLAPEHNLNYYAPYANVYDNRTLLSESKNHHGNIAIGIKIDVFPMDFVADSYNEYNKQVILSKKLNFALWVKRLSLGSAIYKRPLQSLKVLMWRLRYSAYSYAKIQAQIIKNSQLYSNSSYVINIVYPDVNEKRHDAKILQKYENVLFENTIVSIISEYDVYLRSIYGEYMQLPPEEDRFPHHNFEAFWID